MMHFGSDMAAARPGTGLLKIAKNAFRADRGYLTTRAIRPPARLRYWR